VAELNLNVLRNRKRSKN